MDNAHKLPSLDADSVAHIVAPPKLLGPALPRAGDVICPFANSHWHLHITGHPWS